MHRIGLISDTHDLLRPQVMSALTGCDQIIHAGDITEQWVLDELRTIAPVTAVRGNNDRDDWALSLAESATLRVGSVAIHVLHDLKQLTSLPPLPETRVIVSGHSHKPSVLGIEGILRVNPGSAGRRRFKLPVTIAELLIEGDQVSARIIELGLDPPAKASGQG